MQICNDMSHIAQLIADLGRRFSMKDLGPDNYFLGMEIGRKSDGLFISQLKYVHDLLLLTKMAAAKPIHTPAVSGRRLSLQDGDPLPDPTEYRSVVGALQYLTLTCPGIAFTVNQVCQLCINLLLSIGWLSNVSYDIWLVLLLTVLHINLAPLFSLPILTTIMPAILMTGVPLVDIAFTLVPTLFVRAPRNKVGFSVRVPKRSTASSPTQLLQFHGSISFFMIFDFCCIVQQSIVIILVPYLLASNPVFHARTCHVEVDYQYIREKVVRNDLKVLYLSTHDQIVDVFTKGMSVTRFTISCPSF